MLYKNDFTDTNNITPVTPNLSGICAVYKPKGITSSGVVGKVKYILQSGLQKSVGSKVKIKVGHGGTLDPMAEGVLVLGIGTGTKLLNQYLSGTKGYISVGVLGTSTDTLDSTGRIIDTAAWEHINNYDIINSKLDNFHGNITQVPPMYSALKRDGKKLYELAREGIEVERAARNVTVYKLSLIKNINSVNQDDLISNKISSDGNYKLPYFSLEIESSGGFYVRSLIDDLAKSLGTVAHMTDLIRTKQSSFVISDCLYEKDWEYDKLVGHITESSKKLI